LLIFGGIIVRYIFLYQRKKYRHIQEVVVLREDFNRTLLQSKLEIQEQTLDHIAKELHANFSHLVSLININLSELLPQSSDDMKENIKETKALAKQLMADLKALSASLNTDHTLHIGFSKALENELARLGNRKKYDIQFTRLGDEYRLSPEHEIILFRLCQEVLNNIIKYAKAATIKAILHYAPELLILEISDDGVGFDVETALAQSGGRESTGLLNIKRRAALINGGVTINSRPGEGTLVAIAIPKPSNP
jgi:signal transduction histidine kinase